MSGPVKRVGLYLDAAFRKSADGGEVRLYRGAGDFGFMHFAAAVGRHFGRLSVIARETDDPKECPNALPPGLDLIPLPYYPSLRSVGRVLLATPGTLAAMWRALSELDAIWVTGVHPLGLLLAVLGRLRGKRVVLLIRQDSPRYFKHRASGLLGLLAVPPVFLLDLAFRMLSRRLPTTVVGSHVAQRYGAPRPNLLEMHINLLSSGDLVSRPSAADWSERVSLLTVGRIDREKNPMIIPQVLELLERRAPGRFHLTWVGEGPLAEQLAREVARRGLIDRLTLPGYVPFGPELIERYRSAHAFVHIAFTEGVPQVLFEAMGSGLPIVATDVGGVAPALELGAAGLLVPPEDPDAVSTAIMRLTEEPDLRQALATHALELAGRETIESESDRVAAFIRGDGEA
jgi:glycosyltransferase involved in cell wall biosynthesis